MGIDLESVRQRVKAAVFVGIPAFRQVDDVLALSEAIEGPGAIPGAFVSISSERADPNRLSGIHRQRVSTRISVAFVVKAQKASGHRSDEVEAYRSTLKGILMGWTPIGAETALNYASSSIRSIANGLVWVELLFDTTYQEMPA